MKLKIDDLQQKLAALRMKMESKLQEKEFKIIMMKQQLKQLVAQPGIVTPSQTMNRVYSQNELVSMINSAIQQQ